MNIALTNLAVSDTVVCVITIPIRIALYSGSYSHELCHVDLFFHSLSDCIKPSMLVATSYERYQSIAKPFENRGKVRRIIVTVGVSWIIAIFIGIVSTLLTKDGATLYPCSLITVTHIAHPVRFRELLVTLPFGIISLLFVVIFYYLMIKTLNEHRKHMTKNPKAFKNKVSPDDSVRKPPRVPAPTLAVPGADSQTPSNIECTDKTWQNEQYTEVEKISERTCTSPLPSSTSTRKTKENVGPRKLNRNEGSEVGSNENSSVANITEAESLAVQTKRFSIRETRKSILRIMKAQHLIGSRHAPLRATMSLPVKGPDRLAEKNILNAGNTSNSVSGIQQSLTSELSTEFNAETGSRDMSSIELNHDKVSSHLYSHSLLRIPEQVSRSQGNIDSRMECIDETMQLSRFSKCLVENNQEHVRAKVDMVRIVVSDVAEYPKTNTRSDTSSQEKCQNVSSDKGNINQTSETNHVTVNSDGATFIKDTHPETVKSSDKAHTEQSPQGVTEDGVVSVQRNPLNRPKTKDVTVSLMRRESMKSHKIDVVEMDGTVHKRVEVKGAVTGAVCVLNTSNKVQGRRKVEMRAAKRIAVLIGSFVVLWLPLPLCVVSVVSRGHLTSSAVRNLMITGTVSAMTTAANPVLNLLMNKQIRTIAKNNFKRCMFFFKRW